MNKKTLTRRSRSPAIEVQARPGAPLGMSAKQFLREYWQQRPLLIRGMFPGGLAPLTPEDLAGLACEDAALARIVTHHPHQQRWAVRNGPFRESDFTRLGQRQWTLLVQDVDKWDMDVAKLRDHFAFVPSWRVDDVMVSYATDGGGVGAHVDHYDVFLVQGIGYRRWQIDAQPRDFDAAAFRDDSELKLLRQFHPSHEWLLDPGDVLYLPPNVAHDGVALGACTTYSVGMRAPSHAELLLDFAEFLAEPLNENLRYRDPGLSPVRDAGEIDSGALARVSQLLSQHMHSDADMLAHWFGRFITRYRSAQVVAAPDHEVSLSSLRRRLPRVRLLRNPFSRFAWRRHARRAELFVGGDAYPCALALAKQLAAQNELDGRNLVAADAVSLATVKALIDAGHLQLAPRR